MLRIFLLSALRNLLRRKVQSSINVASLALGLTVFGFAFLYVKQELSYDRWPDAERIHRALVEFRGLPGTTDGVYDRLPANNWTQLTDYFAADIEAASRVLSTATQVKRDTLQYSNVWLVDPPFLDIFKPQVLEGDLERVVSGPGYVAVEEEIAARWGLLGHTGERFTFTSINGSELEYELVAIYRVPKPVSFAASVTLLSLFHEYSAPLFRTPGAPAGFDPFQQNVQAWLKLKPGVDTERFNAQQPGFVEQYVTTYSQALGTERPISEHYFQRWQALSDLHFNPTPSEMRGGTGDMARVATFAIVGLLVLLVGCSNSISLSLAAALERRREIGVRKASGALPRDILRQQLTEALLLGLLALIPTIAMLELLLPPFQALIPTVRVDARWSDYALLAGIAVAVGLACGAYPALVLASTRPQAVLRAGAQQRVKGSLGLRNLLVAVQFCCASALLIGTAALYLQLAFTRAQPLGFDADNVVMLYQNDRNLSLAPMRNELAKIPGITQVIRGTNPPNANMPLTVNMQMLVRRTSDDDELEAQGAAGDFDFMELTGMRLLAGRDFDARFDSFDQEAGQLADGSAADVQRIVLNATAARMLGFATPEAAVNEVIYSRRFNRETGEVAHAPMQIIGVAEDNLYASLRRRPGPQFYTSMSMYPDSASLPLMLKFDDTIAATLQQTVQDVSQRLYGVPLTYVSFLEPQLDAAFLLERNESKLLLICGGLAILLASFGLYGLAAFALERQVKEVGVRKVMGASVGAILGLYLWRFSRPIVLANVVAWPVAIYFVLQWIERFPYQMERGWLAPLCLATLAGVLLVAMLTVSIITTRAAAANPVRSLRYE